MTTLIIRNDEGQRIESIKGASLDHCLDQFMRSMRADLAASGLSLAEMSRRAFIAWARDAMGYHLSYLR